MFETLMQFKYWEYIALPLAGFVFLFVALQESGFIKRSSLGISHYEKMNALLPDRTKNSLVKKIVTLILILGAFASIFFNAWRKQEQREQKINQERIESDARNYNPYFHGTK